MRRSFINHLLFTFCLGSILVLHSVNAQSTVTLPVLDYYELKGMLLKQKNTVESMLSMKQFKLVSTKERPESIIYGYRKGNSQLQVLVRIRKSDGRTSEIAWHEDWSTLGSITHDAVFDGFVPVNGNSQYYNRFQKMALFVNYKLAENEIIPCVLRTVE